MIDFPYYRAEIFCFDVTVIRLDSVQPVYAERVVNCQV
jgi:hypothetical protein